jgi:hypothetical protein
MSRNLFDDPCDTNTIEFSFSDVVAQTEIAILLDIGEKSPVWFPRSLCTITNHRTTLAGTCGTVTVPEWWAIQEGLV